MVLENRAPYPVERTLLTSGMTLGGVDSIHHGYSLVKTPEMEVVYQPPRGVDVLAGVTVGRDSDERAIQPPWLSPVVNRCLSTGVAES